MQNIWECVPQWATVPFLKLFDEATSASNVVRSIELIATCIHTKYETENKSLVYWTKWPGNFNFLVTRRQPTAAVKSKTPKRSLPGKWPRAEPMDHGWAKTTLPGRSAECFAIISVSHPDRLGFKRLMELLQTLWIKFKLLLKNWKANWRWCFLLWKSTTEFTTRGTGTQTTFTAC